MATAGKGRRAARRVAMAAVAAGAVGIAIPTVGSSSAQADTYGVTVTSNVSYITEGGASVGLDEYLPTNPTATGTPAAIFVHGGGWGGGDKSEWANDARNFVASTGWPAFSVNYVLNAPNAYWEEFWDVHQAIDWVKARASRFGIDPSRIGLVGDSAGGQLALLAADYGTGPSSGDGRVKAVVSWSGVPDTTLIARDEGCLAVACSQSTQYLGWLLERAYEKTTPAQNPARWTDTSAVTYADPTDPPALLVNSSNELVPLDQLTEMQSTLVAQGVPVSTIVYPGTRHALAYDADAWPATLQFLRQQLTS